MDDSSGDMTEMIQNSPRAAHRAVAPVVGVALLIGITVILVSIAGSVVFATDAGSSEAPETSLSYVVTNGGELELVHEGGDPLSKNEVIVRASNGDEYELATDMVTGDRRPIHDENGPVYVHEVDRITVVWSPPGESSEVVLARFDLQ